MFKNYFERFIDLIISFIAIILLCPLIILVILILLPLNTVNVFYKQLGIGLNCKLLS